MEIWILLNKRFLELQIIFKLVIIIKVKNNKKIHKIKNHKIIFKMKKH